ncbi:MAG TPA: plastocyanin/azurin family copper-binding protein [Gemmatimonadaceae bacterium]
MSSVFLSKSSALLRPSETTTITATAKDANGNTITGHTVTWNNSNSSVASMATNGAAATLTASVLGTTSLTATVDQVTSQAASITVTNSFPTSLGVTVGPGGSYSFDPAQADIGAGATVTFTWAGGVTHNLTWLTTPSPTPPNSGDMSSGSVQVTLNTPGTYNYHCTIHAGMDGSITVH